MAVSEAKYSPRYEVDIGGTTYTEASGSIGQLLVENTVDGADLCTFTLNYPWDSSKMDFRDLDWASIEPGTSLSVAVGWGDDGKNTPIFTGTTQSIQAEFAEEGGPRLTVSGYGLLHEMMRGITERSWEDETVVNVAREVLKEYFSSVTVTGSTSVRNRIIQHNQNDYRFIRQLADDYGFEFFAERDEAQFTQRSSLADSPELTITYGNSLDTFSGEISEADQVKTVEVRYWDMADETEVVGSASNDTGKGKEVYRIACDSQEEADDIAQSKLDSLSMARATGYGEADGIPQLRAGTVIELADLGQRFSRNYYVVRATHRMEEEGYRTAFEVTELPE